MNTMIMNTALQQYANIFTLGMVKAQALAFGTFGITFAIDFVLKILTKLEDGDHLKTIVWSIIKWGTYYYLIKNWPYLVNIVLDSFIKAGNAVANGGISDALMKQPSFFIDTGFKAIEPLADYLKTLNIITDASTFVLTAISMLGTLLAFGVMSIQVFVTYIEFFLLSSLAVIFIPFGAWKHTAFMAEKAFGIVIGFGVKFAVLTTVSSASVVILRNVASSLLDTDPTWQSGMLVLILASAMAYLSWNAPAVAASMMSGGPSLSAGSAVGGAMAVGATAVGGAMAGKAVASGVGSAVGGLSKAGSSVGGALKNASSAMFSGGGGSAGGGGAGNGSFGGGSDTGSAGSSDGGSSSSGLIASSANPDKFKPVDNSTPTASSSSNGSSSGGNSNNSTTTTPPQNDQSQTSGGGSNGGSSPLKSVIANQKPAENSTGSNKQSNPNSINSIAQLVNQAQSAIPPEASPSGGIHVPIKHDD